jgi:hypothetical protein
VLLVLRGKALGSVLDLLVRLLLLRLLRSGPGGGCWGGRRVALGVRVATPIHYRVFAVPIFE